MKHRKGNKKLGRPTDQRIAMLKSIAEAFFTYNRIKTTDIRAKEAKKMIEKIIQLGKKGDVHARRTALKILPNKAIIKDVFSHIAEKYADRDGGYTRIIKLGNRRGDGALMSLLELV